MSIEAAQGRMSELDRRECAPCAEKAIFAAIRACREDDLAAVVKIHNSQLSQPEGLLGLLSAQRIADLYRMFLSRSVFLVHTTDGLIDGFVVGTTTTTALRCRLLFICRHPLLCVGKVVSHSRLWRRAIGSLAKVVGGSLPCRCAGPSRQRFHLLAIAVDRSATRKGIGTSLVRAFEAAVPHAYRQYTLQVLKGNVSAIRFYEKLEFKRVGETARGWKLCKVLTGNAPVPESSSSIDS
jgi:ribosomal protein S18 acetylase RimI-like enzyme